MPKKDEFLELEELELPQLEELVKGVKLPPLNDDGKCILKNIPEFNLEEKRTAQGYQTFMSLFSGSTGSTKTGYDPTVNRAGSIFLSNKSQIRISYLDFVELLKLVNKHIEFVKYQILRTRADLKEEIARKAAFVE